MYDFHSPKQKTAIGNQETEPRPSSIIQIDQNLLGTRLDRLITEKTPPSHREWASAVCVHLDVDGFVTISEQSWRSFWTVWSVAE